MHASVTTLPQPATARAAGRRYLTLDAMRGVAAVVVVLYHYGLSFGSFRPRFGYLAVDLFFVLSGFVLAHANDKRFRTSEQGFLGFMKARAIRLGPLYILGSCLGLVALAVGVDAEMQHQKLAVDVVANFVGLPGLYAAPRGSLFPLNRPFWSLFFELWVANLAFALFWRQLHGKVLGVTIALFGVGLLISDKFWFNINVGWSASNFAGGFARVGFSFFAGVALSRFHRARPPTIQLPSLVVLAVCLASFLVPLEHTAAHLYEMFVVLLLYPALVYFGAEAVERRPWVGDLLGDASYALYTVHMPVVMVLALILEPSATTRTLPFQIGVVGALLAFAMGAAQVDKSVRRHLSAKPCQVRAST